MNNEIINVSSVGSAAYRNVESVRGVSPSTVAPEAPSEDVVEFSEISRSLAAEVSSSSFRQARLEAIRRQIAEGTYETAERIRGTVDRLVHVVN